MENGYYLTVLSSNLVTQQVVIPSEAKDLCTPGLPPMLAATPADGDRDESASDGR